MRLRCHRCTRLVSKRFVVASTALVALLAVSTPFSAYAFVRLSNGPTGLAWPGGGLTPIPFTISTAFPAPGISDGSADAAIRMAFQQWASVGTTAVRFQEDLRPDQRARTDWHASDLHLVWFDADGSSGQFTSNAGLVAITPVSFSGGAITDADIIFNAKDHSFSTNGSPGTFDVQNIATHEVGHFVGLDHSPVLGATMSPFAVVNDTRLRSLEKDDVAAASTVYPGGGTLGSISGQILDAALHPISGAHLVAEDASGAPASSTLSRPDGGFQILGLPQGSYTLYAEPLDGPVVGHNLALGISGLAIDTAFGTTFLGGESNPTSIFVNTGADTSIGPFVARTSVGMTITSASPNALHPGDSATIVALGSGFHPSDVPSITGSGFTVHSFTVSSSSFSLDVSVGTGAASGIHSIRLVRSTGDARVLTGGVEVRNAAPTLSAISPGSGPAGTQITLTGTNLWSGGAAIVGSGLVQSPSAGGTQASFACPDVPAGTYDVTFQNQDGQFAAIKQGFKVTASSSSSAGSSGAPSHQPSAPSPSAASVPAPSASPSGAPGPIGAGGGGGGGGCELDASSGEASVLAPLLALALLVLATRFRRAAISS